MILKPKIDKDGTIHFTDYPNFKPNLTPEQIFRMGSFGGTYWRPIYSSITKKNYKNEHLKFPKKWWNGLSKDWLILSDDDYNKNINKYKVRCGSSLEDWEKSEWIKKYDPYGWVQWYCNFFMGRRGKNKEEIEYDEYQIKRWINFASEKGRFRKSLITYIIRKDAKFDDFKVSPKIRQSLQHWAYILTENDFKKELKRRINN